MKRERAQEAVDAAFSDGLKGLFGVLVRNLATGEETAVDKFRSGIANHDDAHARASAEIEKIFPE